MRMLQSYIPPYLACAMTSNTMDPSVPPSFIEKTQEQ